jgi:hypothetical protein
MSTLEPAPKTIHINTSVPADRTLHFVKCNHTLSQRPILPSNPSIFTLTNAMTINGHQYNNVKRYINEPAMCFDCSLEETKMKAKLAREEYTRLCKVELEKRRAEVKVDSKQGIDLIKTFTRECQEGGEFWIEWESGKTKEVWVPFVEMWDGAMKTGSREVLNLKIVKEEERGDKFGVGRVVGVWVVKGVWKGVNGERDEWRVPVVHEDGVAAWREARAQERTESLAWEWLTEAL